MTPPPAVRPRARLWLVRHAQPVVAAGTCYGALDVPADAAATQVAAQRLAQALPAGAAAHYSTLQRCELLALATQALQPNLTIHPDARLREMDFGAWEGHAWDSIGQSAIDVWTADAKQEGVLCEHHGCQPLRKIVQYDLKPGAHWVVLEGKAPGDTGLLLTRVGD